MMIGEFPPNHPTVQIPSQLDAFEDPTAAFNSISPFLLESPDCKNPFNIPDSFGSLQRFLPSNDPDDISFPDELSDLPLDAFTCDNFRMYDFKVRRCARGRSHDWTECPFAHPGEKARRRDPRKYNYSGAACPEFRKGACRRGDSCEFAHGVFECWLHPDRYRTQACKDGMGCGRRICFFAHSPDQLRVMNIQSPRRSSLNLNSLSLNSNSAESYDGSPLRRSFDLYMCNNNNNFNTMPFNAFASASPTTSPPSSPLSSSYSELICNMRNLQLAKAKLSPTSAWGFPSSVGSPRNGSSLRPGYGSVPTRSGMVQFEQWELNNSCGNQEEVVLERVEFGRDLRGKLDAKLSKENSFGRPVCEYEYQLADSDLDVGWISDLVQ